MNPYDNLANAIILRAVADYRQALRRCNKNPEQDAFRYEKTVLERFFRSNWFGALTNLDPEILIRKLYEEVT